MKTEMAEGRIARQGKRPGSSNMTKGWLTAPGISVALLPKLACPLCWPFYSGIVSSVGLGFLISTKYLLALTIALFILTLAVLAFHAKQRRRYEPFALGIIGAMAVLIGKFGVESNAVTFTGIVVLVVASAWNMWPLPTVKSCSCNCQDGNPTRKAASRSTY
jgi:hypothetical protein